MAEPTNRYDLTAARAHGRPGREIRPRSLTVDIHSHVLVPAAAAYVGPHQTPDPRSAVYSEDTRILSRQQDEDRTPNLVNLALRMRDFDAMGIDAQVISPAPAQCYYNVPAEVGIEAARMVNEGVASIAARMPDRIPAAMGSVPLQAGGEAAASELEYAVKTLGLKGVEVLAHVGDLELSDPSFEPFWAKAEALGAVVFIHPSGFTEPRRFGRFYFSNVIGNPLDTTMALHHLIFDGVLERYPGLKIIASHGGGYLPAYSGRIDHAWGARSDAHGALPKPPTFLSEENPPRHDRFHPRPVGSLDQTIWRGQDPARDRLSLRHGGIRPDRSYRLRGLIYRSGPGGDRRGECEGFVRVVRQRAVC